MRNEKPPPSRRRLRLFVNGVGVGLLCAIATDLAPIYGLPLVLLAAIASLAFKPRAPGFAGILIGAGGMFLFGVINTWAACRQTEDFCGEANIQPLLILAVAMLALGFAAGTASLVRFGR